MQLVPIHSEHIQRTAQILLGILDSEAVSIPGNLSEGLSSGKSLLRGILQGNVVVCERKSPPVQVDEAPAEAAAPEEAE